MIVKMNKLKKVIIIMIIINFIVNILIGFYQSKTYATTQKINSNINEISNSKYPKIKSMIQSLQKTHPNWNFKVLYTGLDWKDVITGEYSGHGKSPNNLVPANNKSYAGKWICTICGTKTYDSGNWYCASEDAIKYMIDPRNSLNSSDIFQFLQLSYLDTTYNDLQKMVANYKYLNKKTTINAILNAGKKHDVNPYYIVARIIQEQGKGTSILVTGEKYKGTNGVTYSGYYNIFNVGAAGNSVAEIYTNGLKYAKSKGWTSLEKSIEGGITTIANNYIANGQDTMYFQKFNVSSTKYSHYTHQYMQNILAAQTEGTTLKSTLTKMGYLEGNYTFIIPLYENMPSTACSRPSTTSSSTSSQSSDYKLGDANDDGKINSGDILVIQKHLLGTAVVKNEDLLKIMDINKDGKINSGDLLALKKYLLGTYNIVD